MHLQDVLTRKLYFPNSKYPDLQAPGVENEDEELVALSVEDFKRTAMWN